MGAILVPTDDSNAIPPFPAHVLAGQTVTYTGVYAYTLSGSLTADLTHNGTPIPGLTGITITDTPFLFTPDNPIVVADMDLFGVTPDTVSTALGLVTGWFKTMAIT